MQTWAKRGIQTALVTGGLLMLGTGIASADENVSPDTPAGPLDLNVTIPIDVDDNAIGLPDKQVNLPGYHGEISTKPITEPVQQAIAPVTEQLKPVTAPVAETVNKATGALNQAGQQLAESQEQSDEPSPVPFTQPERAPIDAPQDALDGNRVDVDLVAPVQIAGNALALGGDAAVETDVNQSWSHDDDVTTSGSPNGPSGNAVVLDWAAPVQVAGNAIGAFGGQAVATGSATQETEETGTITTDGTQSGLSGNVLAGQAATPVQVTGNAAAALLGTAASEFDAATDAEAGGAVLTDGADQFGSGNVGALPAALPVKLNGNAVPVLAPGASAASDSIADATAGGTATGINDVDSYVQTGGDHGTVSGNVVQPQGAGVATASGNAVAALGNALSGNGFSRAEGAGSTSSEVVAGGFTSTTGANGAASGNIVDAPVGLPAEVFAGAVGVGGAANAAMDSETSVTAGDGTFANGNDSLLSGNTASSPIAGAAEAYGNAVGALGAGQAVGTEVKDVTAGGYNGTLGNDAAGSGNLITTPVALPAELFGAAAGAVGGAADASASEIKDISAGGDGNTTDDYGKISSNLIAAPVSLPAQLFGVGAAAGGVGNGAGSTETTSTAGGNYKATGPLGAIAGNLVQAPVSLPAQLHGLAAGGLGAASGTSDNLTDSAAGGDAYTDGAEGAITGNIVQAPVGAAGSLFGLAAGAAGLAEGQGVNDVVSAAGGDSVTDGTAGSLAGNVVSAQGLAVAQAFGDAVDVAGSALGTGTNTTDVTSGGDIDTDGTAGSLAGNILDVPAAAVVQAFGDAVSVLGTGAAFGDNVTEGSVGGSTSTAGAEQSLSGFDAQLPVVVPVQVYDVPVRILGLAFTEAMNVTGIDVAGDRPSIELPANLGELPADSLPAMPSLPGGPQPVAPRADLADGPMDVQILPAGVPVDDMLETVQTGVSVENTSKALDTLIAGLPADEVLDAPFSGRLPIAERADNPLADLLDVQLPVIDKVLGGLPLEGELPTGNLPVGELPVDAPATGQLPLVPMDLTDAAAPSVEQVDTDPLAIFDRLVDELTGKKFHIQ